MFSPQMLSVRSLYSHGGLPSGHPVVGGGAGEARHRRHVRVPHAWGVTEHKPSVRNLPRLHTKTPRQARLTQK